MSLSQYPKDNGRIRADWNPGQSQFLTNPMPASPLAFNLSLDESVYGTGPFGHRIEDSDARLFEILQAQAARGGDASAAEDEDSIAADEELSDEEKRAIFQTSLHMAASNGNVERVQRLVNGEARGYIDVNGADEEGTAPLIYASCFVSFCSNVDRRTLCLLEFRVIRMLS